MGLHQEILPQVLGTCASIHEECGVVLIGSVARDAARPDSDLDLNIIFPRDECPLGMSSYVESNNRWQLQLKDVVQGVRIDVAWETEHALLERLSGDEAVNCWPFSGGTIVRDPRNVAGPCLELARAWFAAHPDVALRFEQEYNEAKREQLARRQPDD